jgi:hypothetical protein
MRKYLPTIPELIDRRSIVLMKQIFLDPKAYAEEAALIEHDIDELSGKEGAAYQLRMIMMIMLSNRWIWENESTIRKLGRDHSGEVSDRLRGTHSINGIRNRAKNELARILDERQDQKIDCLAADLPKEFGNWDVFLEQDKE